jgi:hypothetical protein
MAFNPSALLEVGDSESGWSGSINPEAGKMSRVYRYPGLGPFDLPAALIFFSGYTSTALYTPVVGTLQLGGGVNRILPPADPQITPWVCMGADRFWGKGKQVNTYPSPAVPALGGPAPLPNAAGGFGNYPETWFAVTFNSRPYPVLPDSAVPGYSSDVVTELPYLYVPPGGGAGTQYYVYPEWRRFMTFKEDVQDDWVTAKNQAITICSYVGGVATAPIGYPLVEGPRVYLPNSILTVEMFAVPLRFVLSPNSYLNRYKGTINQTGVIETTSSTLTTNWVYPPGTLLYLNYSYDSYTSSSLQLQNWINTPSSKLQTPDKLCNVKLKFLVTRRTGTNVPTAAQIGNANFLPLGHNLLPFPGATDIPQGWYYYTRSQGGNPAASPMFFSAPHTLLFANDPDLASSLFI